jgi:PleD family two-component response regulator
VIPAEKDIVFVVDDTPTNLSVLFQALDGAGFRVLVATNGQSALEAISEAGPDLILLDIMMPGLDGFETCRRLKQSEVTQAIPVIFMTALTETVDEVKGLELGAVDYITKPIRVETVLARVRTHLALQKLRGELERKNSELEEALANIKILRGLLPICANCKKIQDDEGYWQEVEEYIKKYTEANFSHGFCPECMKLMFGDLFVPEGSLPNS